MRQVLHARRRVFASLLGALLVVPAAAFGSGAGQVSTITDKRITESSSLALSSAQRGIVYTANDSKSPIVFAVDVETGTVVGATELVTPSVVTPTKAAAKGKKSKSSKKKGKKSKSSKKSKKKTKQPKPKPVVVVDPEAMALDPQGVLWVADLGDNLANRHDGALYALKQPQPGDKAAAATRYPIAYPGGASYDVETLLIHPKTGAKLVITKAKKGQAKAFALPAPLRTDAPNVPRAIKGVLPDKVSDGAYSPDGRWILVRDAEVAYVLDAKSLKVVRTISLPTVKQGESVTFERGGKSFLIGSEGANSPLIRVAFGH